MLEKQEIKILKDGGLGVLLTDTLYGVVGRALDEKAVAKIYEIKGRNSKKPLIILISSVKDLKLFGVKVDVQDQKTLENFWPGPVSVVLSCPLKKFEYLHRGTKTLAFRLPCKKALVEAIKITGPLVAPSANPEGMPPAKNISQAKKYFAQSVDFYVRGGRPKGKPSQIVSLSNGVVTSIRN